MHNLSLITTIAAGFTAAWCFGLLTQRLGLSAIVGYLMAGIVIGPHTPGFSGDVEIGQQLAEVGVILLMFGVGLHFHLKDLLAVKSVAIPGAIGQSAVATLLSIAAFTTFGFTMSAATVIGMAISVASTVVLMRVLMDADALNSAAGHVAVGWLLVEDVFTVIVLVLIPVLGSNEAGAETAAAASTLWVTISLALLNISLLVAIVLFAGTRVIPWVLVQVARLRSRELFTLTILVFSIAIATGSYLVFGASMALGAFLAGMVVGQSPVSHQAAADALPLRDAFAVLFFVSVGMLFDPAFVLEEPLMILAALLIILLAKPAAALVIVSLLGHSTRTALTVALGLAQIGEFSFILSQLAREHGVMPESGHNVLVAAAIISITLNPLLFRSLGRIESKLQAYPRLWAWLNARAERRAAQINSLSAGEVGELVGAGQRVAIVVGYGPVGRSVHRLLKEAGLATVIIDLNMDTISQLHREGQTAIFGDAARQPILEQAGVARASYLILTLPHSSDRAAVVLTARSLNPTLRILVRARYLAERETLDQAGATAAVFEEAEAAVGLARLVLADTGANREVVERAVRDLRLTLIRENVKNLRGQTVRSIMVPWTRVERLSKSSSREEVLRMVGGQHFSRWPVVDPQSGRPVGYLFVKDLLAERPTGGQWTELVRPVQTVRPDDDIELALSRLQTEGTTLCIVKDADSPVGLITLEDILEQVVGRIENEYSHDSAALMRDALRRGHVLLELSAGTADQAIGELAAAIPKYLLPRTADIGSMGIARESQASTDLGVGVAIPHARVPNLEQPIVAMGRSRDGVLFSPQSAELVKLVFLLITPLEKPDIQLFLLAQLARVAGDPASRERLEKAISLEEVIDVVTQNSDRRVS
jgi:monovalent cation:H+ antiporter-2, CPA2 family